jgi:hypothetical protein
LRDSVQSASTPAAKAAMFMPSAYDGPKRSFRRSVVSGGSVSSSCPVSFVWEGVCSASEEAVVAITGADAGVNSSSMF